jgi:hypothetical protein
MLHVTLLPGPALKAGQYSKSQHHLDHNPHAAGVHNPHVARNPTAGPGLNVTTKGRKALGRPTSEQLAARGWVAQQGSIAQLEQLRPVLQAPGGGCAERQQCA